MDAAAPPPVLSFPRSDASPTRGVRWVLAWAMAFAVLVWSAIMLTAFAYQLAAEQTMSQAVVAGLREATCERATGHSVERLIRRRLGEQGIDAGRASIATQRNGTPLSGTIRCHAGDQVMVSLSIPAESVLPAWLARVGGVNGPKVLTVWADRIVADI